MPGQTGGGDRHRQRHGGPSMEGRAIARPNISGRPPMAVSSSSLQWRAGQLPGQTPHLLRALRRAAAFNGGPGNCPAKPRSRPHHPRPHHDPSMEGRAIARPNRPPSPPPPGASPPFNGGPGNCPAQPQGSLPTPDPPREARAIARPTRPPSPPPPGASPPFNGGPGNCPAKPECSSPAPNLTTPSMEGRAIARPNQIWVVARQLAGLDPSMEGRAIARPNRRPLAPRPAHPAPSMEGRAIARPNQTRRATGPHTGRAPSMEGRAIARPNVIETSTARPSGSILQWRAGQLPGQTAATRTPRRPRRPAFNGGPGNCPAKPRRGGERSGGG